MLAKCATCNKTFIKKSDETDCPGCIISGPTADLPPVKARRAPDLSDVKDLRKKSPVKELKGVRDRADRPERGEGVPEIERKPVSVRIILGLLMIVGGIAYTIFRFSTGAPTVYGPIIVCVGIFNVLTAIYDGSKKNKRKE